ncbi:hypothetical protein QTG56_14890 [Rossellomorea sp. AcN35-11]|nr:hypothetical protein [Rossellomorea aquimaris]WJV28379.1 hypothetical protein QTG56_14890 [Rossellomorea sp. AcN35-11]
MTVFSGTFESSDITLTINKQGESYRCNLKNKKDYLEMKHGVGTEVGNHLVMATFNSCSNLIEQPIIGVCIYTPIGDQRSLTALWTTINDSYLGSGIAIKSDRSPQLEGKYTVRYFAPEEDSVTLDVYIHKEIDTYSLSWYLGEKQINQGVGIRLNDQLFIAWGDMEIKCELHVFSFNPNDKYSLRCISILSNTTLLTEKTFVRIVT